MCPLSEDLESIHGYHVIPALVLECMVVKHYAHLQPILVLDCCIVLEHYVRLQPIHHSPQGRMSLDEISTSPKQ
jgi:hypothetical protein